MKNVFRIMLAAAMSVAMLALVACDPEKPDPEQNNPSGDSYTESTSYGIIIDGQNVAAGATINHVPSATETENDFASVDMLINNKTNDDLPTCLKVELLEGPDAMERFMMCYGPTCKEGHCPWTSDVFTLVPGINEDMLIKFEYYPSSVTSKTVYRITVGKGTKLSDPQVILINAKAGA